MRKRLFALREPGKTPDSDFRRGDFVVRAGEEGLLRDRLVTLAGTPDDSARVGSDLIIVAQLAANRVTAIDFASVTSKIAGVYATVAASSDLAVAVDQAQYADEAGPCLEALEAGYPTAVPDIAATMSWPGFRDTAVRFGLQASLSVPLFAGSGTTIAALNLYGRDPDAMKKLTTAVWAAFEPGDGAGSADATLDAGGREFTAGLIGALALRDRIQQAVGILMGYGRTGSERAYLELRMRAAEAGVSLADTAAHLIEENQS
jgi:hypothetical protein